MAALSVRCGIADFNCAAGVAGRGGRSDQSEVLAVQLGCFEQVDRLQKVPVDLSDSTNERQTRSGSGPFAQSACVTKSCVAVCGA